ncbi:MAG: DPP IV N-terminal domain-containing protein, partial [Acidimicrobiales bacterium]
MAEPIAFEEIARLPLPGTALPTAFAFSPAGDLLTFLDSAEGGLERDLFGLDPASGQRRLLLRPEGGGVGAGGLSLEEQLGRERRRDVGLGVTRYAWARDAPVIVVPLPAGAFVGRPDGNLRLLVPASDGEALDPHLSPDGTMLAFVRAGEVHVAATTGAGAGAPRPLTSGADPAEGRTHGLAEFIAEEEMGRRGGMWWSPGSRWLAVTEVDESEVALWRLGAGGEEAHRYPFAGQANARVRLGVVAAAGAPPRWFALDAEYLARVAWTPGGALVAQLQDRSQRRLDLVRIDPTTGATALLWAEEGEPWVNLHDLYWPLECAGGAFLWGSEASGFRHLSLHGPDGSLTRVLTAGDWVVDQVEGVDEERGLAYVTASRDGPTERHLYAVALAGGEPQRVTAEPGVHTVRLDRRTTRFVDVHSALDHPPTVA